MYLFQPRTIARVIAVLLYLHSTMYLFQLLCSKIRKEVKDNLHSTMYLFQPAPQFLQKTVGSYLHSTMYLFQPNALRGLVTEIPIYIPLCIYFNEEMKQNIYGHHNLHSTMYLFQRRWFRRFHHGYRYLHSTMYLFQLLSKRQFVCRNVIYIPLCIYFNPIRS